MTPNLRNRIAAVLIGAVAAAHATLALGAAPKAYVGNFKDNTVSVIDTATAAVVATVAVASGPHGMTQGPDGRRVYISGDTSSAVSVIDTATDRVASTIDVGKAPHGLAMTPDGRLLLVAVYGEDRVGFFDTGTQQQTASAAVAKPHTIAVRPDGTVAYVASQDPGKFALAVIDLKSFAVLRTVPLDKPPRDLEFGADGKLLYITIAGENWVAVLDPGTDRIVARIPTGISPHVATVFAGARVGTAVVQGPGELMLFDPATHAVLRSVAVGKQPHWVAADSSGATAWVTNEGSNDVTIVDLAGGPSKTVAVGSAPRKVVVQRIAAAGAGAAISINNFAFAPGAVVIDAGQTVTWTNNDGAPHGLAYRDGASGIDLMLPGAQFKRRFDAPGTYDYVCSVHPFMLGKVVVRSR